jgi:hypothetical protein
MKKQKITEGLKGFWTYRGCLCENAELKIVIQISLSNTVQLFHLLIWLKPTDGKMKIAGWQALVKRNT